jgi:hypothetical protein
MIGQFCRGRGPHNANIRSHSWVNTEYIYFMKKAIEAEALLIFENELALSIRNWKYKATLRSSAGRGLRGLIKEPHQKTNVFQGPTYEREWTRNVSQSRHLKTPRQRYLTGS